MMSLSSTSTVTTTTTADYWVGSTIGEGSYGKVVHARHKATKKDVAIKVVTKMAVSKDPLVKDSLWKERRLLMQLKSDYVVALWASFHDEECLYFVLECATGGDLQHLIQNQIPVPAIPSYFLQIVSALEFLHSANVIHGDLKPENIVVTEHGKLKLADFGSAVELPCVEYHWMGTVDYASPEVVRGVTQAITVSVDLWALGCILYAMCEGVSPFHDRSDALAIQRIVNFSGHVKTSTGSNEALNVLVRDLLSPDPSQRLGMEDLKTRQGNDIVYLSIRMRSCLQNREDVTFEIPTPLWWTKTLKNGFRDGAMGWSTFML